MTYRAVRPKSRAVDAAGGVAFAVRRPSGGRKKTAAIAVGKATAEALGVWPAGYLELRVGELVDLGRLRIVGADKLTGFAVRNSSARRTSREIAFPAERLEAPGFELAPRQMEPCRIVDNGVDDQGRPYVEFWLPKWARRPAPYSQVFTQ